MTVENRRSSRLESLLWFLGWGLFYAIFCGGGGIFLMINHHEDAAYLLIMGGGSVSYILFLVIMSWFRSRSERN